MNVRGDLSDVPGQDSVDNRGLTADVAIHRRAGTSRRPSNVIEAQPVQSVPRYLRGGHRHDAIGGHDAPIASV
ncbi:hypothetical protein UI24_09695 [Mycobacteroides franklinii]|nr:hypothetical protein [Mycobacteroides franklinii]